MVLTEALTMYSYSNITVFKMSDLEIVLDPEIGHAFKCSTGAVRIVR